jgi:16S rRNA (guanine527-N7)-methyltransferase
MTDLQFKSLCEEAGLSVSAQRMQKLEQFANFFIGKNKVINLASIGSREEFLVKHIMDSLLMDRFLQVKQGDKVADLGTGGGLPGIPLAIMHPDAEFTLIDSVQKKIQCVEEFLSQLGLKNITGLSDRLEVIGQDKKYREQFDVVIARALAPLPVLLELSLPLVKVGGVFAAMKGPGYLEEINDANDAMRQLGVDLPRAERYELPGGAGKRYLLIFEKKKVTSSKFPRRTGVPQNKPL